jgi:hypothetical protein
MRIYSAVNVENLKFCEPSMLDEENEDTFLPTIEELAPDAKAESVENTILHPFSDFHSTPLSLSSPL